MDFNFDHVVNEQDLQDDYEALAEEELRERGKKAEKIANFREEARLDAAERRKAAEEAKKSKLIKKGDYRINYVRDMTFKKSYLGAE